MYGVKKRAVFAKMNTLPKLRIAKRSLIGNCIGYSSYAFCKVSVVSDRKGYGCRSSTSHSVRR
jgi:hypothetical protein